MVPEEPLVATGLAATLQLLNQQGGGKALELDSYGGRARVSILPSPFNNNILIHCLGGKRQQQDKVLEIPDSDDPAPSIRLDKYDQFGRKMTPREAFRHLSHRFHGKTPGKKKTEKKIQKYSVTPHCCVWKVVLTGMALQVRGGTQEKENELSRHSPF